MSKQLSHPPDETQAAPTSPGEQESASLAARERDVEERLRRIKGRTWRAWHDDKPEIMCVREQTGDARNREGEKNMSERATSWKAQAKALLDVRPELEQGGEPFVRIMEAASAIKPGGTLVIVAPFEPVPLYAVLEAQGFEHETEKVAADEWVVRFTRR